MRTQEEIVAYLRANGDMFGFCHEVLVPYLDYAHARPFLKSGLDPKDWAQLAQDEEKIRAGAREYSEFAWTKAADHRGISASRSIDKLTAWAFLLGRDDVVAAMEHAPYENYGCPKLKAFCEMLGFPIPTDEGVERMMRSQKCTPECTGCGA